MEEIREDVGRTRLMQLALKGYWTTLEEILNGIEKVEDEVSQVDEDFGLSLLMFSAQKDRLSVVERLLKLEVSPEEKTKDGQTALHFAAAHASGDIVNLLAQKTDPNTPGGPKAWLPLHYAAFRSGGSIDVVRALLKLSNKEARLTLDEDGCIPLLLAIKARNVEIVRELLSDLSEPQLQAKMKENGDTALHICCRMKNVEMAKVLVEFNANLDSQNDEGQTPLHKATWEGDQAMVKYFYYRIANPNITDKLDRHPLHIAAERGLANVVEILTDNFKSNVLERTKDGSTLLHIAAQCGHPETAKTLLNKGVPLHIPNKSGEVCLHVAAKYGHTAVVWNLLLKGAHVDTTTKDGLTALHIAAENCHPQVVQILQGFGAQVQLRGGKDLETPLHIAARVRNGEKVAEMLLKSGAEVNTEQENGETAMHVAARHGSLLVMKALVEEGADLTWKSKEEETPLHVAVRHCQAHMVAAILNYLTTEKSRKEAEICVRQGNQKGETSLHLAAEIHKDIAHRDDEDVLITRTLMEHNADVTAATRQMDETPIHYSARVGNIEVLQEMLHNVPSNCLPAAINRLNKTGRSALLLAAEQGHRAIVTLLLQNHARVDVFDKEGKSALHLAAEQGHEDIADILLSNKAFVHAKTKLGLTPLHLSAQTGSSLLVQLLIQTHQACTDALTLSKQTPLHLAAISGRLDICNSLLNLGADVTVTDMYGQTPLHLAAENDHSDVVKLFLKHRPELSTLANMDGSTCINIAAAKGSVAVIRELLMFSKSGLTTLHNKVNGSGPLHLAAAGGHTEVVMVLLDAGASASEEDSEGMTAVHLAARSGHIHILEVLKAKVSLKISSSKTGLTALHVAACFGQVDFMREILTQEEATVSSEPPDIDTSGKLQPPAESGYTPLHFAAQSGHENVVRLLLNSPGVLADAETNPECFTPLHLAAQRGHTDVVGLLLSRSSTLLHLQDRQGRSCLHLASAQGHVATVRVLLCHGADINHMDKTGWSALHYAAKAGRLEVVRLLVERGASVYAECHTGHTPLQYAAEENHLTTVSFLLQQPDNKKIDLLEDKKFVLDLMLCGRLNSNLALDEMVLYSAAPLATAVRLSRALSLVSLREKVHFIDLRTAALHCETMASDLLNLASTADGMDVGMVLRAVYRGSCMLDCLIEGKQKNVMSNPGVQKYLTDVWRGNMNWHFKKILLLFFCMLICPFLWLALTLPLKHRYNNIPIVKLISHLVSHIFLLLLFICTIVHPFGSPTDSRLIPGWSECLLLIWLCGLLLSGFKQKAERVGLAWIRMFLLYFSVVALICHILAVALQSSPKYFISFLFARNVLLAVAMTLAFIQLLEFLMFHHLFGPWAIIIKNMMRDLYRFAIILLLFHVAFSLSFTAICQPLNPQTSFKSNNSENGTYRNVTSSEINTLHIPVLLFFALFGLTDRKDIPCSEYSPAKTSGLTHLAFGIYMVVTVVVLLNLLIAMMSNTYQCIQDQSDTEWKFGRAILIRDMSCKAETPSPFNLLTCLYFNAKSAYKRVRELCSVKRQNLIREEEEEGWPETHSLGTMTHSSLHGIMGNQIYPRGCLIMMPQTGEQVPVEDVTDWTAVVQRFLALHGQKDRAAPETDDLHL